MILKAIFFHPPRIEGYKIAMKWHLSSLNVWKRKQLIFPARLLNVATLVTLQSHRDKRFADFVSHPLLREMVFITLSWGVCAQTPSLLLF